MRDSASSIVYTCQFPKPLEDTIAFLVSGSVIRSFVLSAEILVRDVDAARHDLPETYFSNTHELPSSIRTQDHLSMLKQMPLRPRVFVL